MTDAQARFTPLSLRHPLATAPQASPDGFG